jgi:hypothetical protein
VAEKVNINQCYKICKDVFMRTMMRSIVLHIWQRVREGETDARVWIAGREKKHRQPAPAGLSLAPSFPSNCAAPRGWLGANSHVFLITHVPTKPWNHLSHAKTCPFHVPIDLARLIIPNLDDMGMEYSRESLRVVG